MASHLLSHYIMFLLYRRPVAIICALNLAALSLIALSWPARDSAQAQARPAQCDVPNASEHPTAVQLKVRAAKIFEAQRSGHSLSEGYLTALSTAVDSSSWEKVEALLNEYDCGRTL